jgi:hypothetical protein
MDFDLIASPFVSLLFIAAGVYSLLIIFNKRVRTRFLKHGERQSWHILPVKKSDVQQRRELSEGTTLAGAIIVVLIFLPLGLIMFVVSIWNVFNALFR